MGSQNFKPLKYRPDIDGLRAIAVFAVLLFHFFPNRAPGGFAGVDIFFVISGYLVTGIIYSDVIKSSFSFVSFYQKRVRRIFPSLILTLFLCFGIGWVLLMADELLNLGLHLFAGSTFLSNFLLFKESGYFDKSSDLKPLLHLWSLCIEEQFYMIWPLLIFASHKLGKVRVASALWIVFAASLGLNLYLTPINPIFSFFLLPTRLWELALGGLLVFNRRHLDFSIVGLACITLTFYTLNKETNFPGSWALLPTIGTACIILSGSNGRFNKLLSWKPLVYAGLISYPLYLWHWPLISFAHIFFSGPVPVFVRLCLIIVSCILAIFSYEFLEKPLRKKMVSWRQTASICSGLIIAGLVGLLIWKMEGASFRYPELETIRQTGKRFVSTKDSPDSQVCQSRIMNIEMCAISKSAQNPTVALIGDSHANHFYPGLKEYYHQTGENLLLLYKSATPPLYKTAVENAALPNLDDVFNFIESTQSIHTVIISSFWASYFTAEGVQVSDFKYYNPIIDPSHPELKAKDKIFTEAFSRTIEHVLSKQRKLIVFYDIPSLPFHLEKCLPRPFRNASNCSFDQSIDDEKQNGYRKAMREILKKYPTIQVFDPVPYICKEKVCQVIKDDSSLYSDDFHLSIQGSKLMGRTLAF